MSTPPLTAPGAIGQAPATTEWPDPLTVHVPDRVGAPPGAHCAPAERLAWALALCARTGLRLTSVRRRVLEIFAEETSPINLDAVAHAEALRGRCAATTVYRTLVLFCDAGLIRQVNLRSKSRFFVLNVPGEAHDHLLCRRCGASVCLPHSNALATLLRELAAAHGYSDVAHEVELCGLCPACQKVVRAQPPVTKLRQAPPKRFSPQRS
jgi:Fur family zinc uptake transcriptional regulator